MFRRSVLSGILSLSLLPLVARAGLTASSREYFASVERRYNLPDALLYSIALVESGKKRKELFLLILGLWE